MGIVVGWCVGKRFRVLENDAGPAGPLSAVANLFSFFLDFKKINFVEHPTLDEQQAWNIDEP